MTRFIDPWQLAAPPLAHEGHQQGPDTNKNHDLLYINWLPEGEAQVFRTEIKSMCFGLCEEGQQNTWRVAKFQKLREKYAPSISLISSCCSINPITTIHSVAALLQRESDVRTKPGDVQTLDELTEQLIYNITAGPGAGKPQIITAPPSAPRK